MRSPWFVIPGLVALMASAALVRTRDAPRPVEHAAPYRPSRHAAPSEDYVVPGRAPEMPAHLDNAKFLPADLRRP